VAVHSTADEDAMHVRLADESVLHRPTTRQGQLSQYSGVACCLRDNGRRCRASGLRLSCRECAFRGILAEHNVHFIGPPPEHIRLMGDKIAAKRAAKQLGIPVVPGSDGGVSSDEEARILARDVGYPLILKASAGGGGRGMKVVRAESELASALAMARAESKAAFGDDTVYLEKYLEKPRHIEIQVLGDGKGRAIHLGERDCSLQRRHQKVWEEGPSPALNTSTRDEIGETVAKAMRDIKYLGVGTVEFLYEDGKFAFIEMNTRIQVEHPVTRNDHRHRPYPGANPRRRRQRSRARAKRREVPRPRHRVPHQCRERRLVSPLTGQDCPLSSARRARRASRFGRLPRLRDTAVL